MGLTLKTDVVIEAGDVISQATLRTEDLIESFLGFIEAVCTKDSCAYLLEEYNEALGWDGTQNNEDEDALSYFLNETLFDAMNEVAPDNLYFGAHEGDGSLFGYWEVEEEVDED